MTNKSVTITDSTIGTQLKDWLPSLKEYAVRNYNETAFVRSAMLCIVDKPELQECLKTPTGKTSLFQALRFAASTGLSLNPQEGKAALIAYGGKCQYQVMKGGMIDLAMDSGKVDFITADIVKEHDKFEMSKTDTGDTYVFSPHRKDRGQIDGFFAAIRLKEGGTQVKYMTLAEMEAHRDKYSALYKAKPEKSPWHEKKSFEGMSLKTVIKALLRSMNLSPELSTAIGSEDKSQNQSGEIELTRKKGTGADDLVHTLENKENQQAPTVTTATGATKKAPF